MRGKNVGDDLKAMAQDVADLGAGYVRLGRRWLEMQRDQVAEGVEDIGSQEVPPEPGEGRGRRGGRDGLGGRRGRGQHHGRHGWQAGGGAGMDSYLDDESTFGYSSSGGASTDDDPDYPDRGSETFGRSSYRGVGPKNYTRSDQRITEDLCEGLTRCHHVDPSDITVNVSGGVVTLTGTVRDRWMKHRIEDLAAGCDGVRNVENNIQVPGTARASQATSPGDTTLPDADA